MQVRKIISGILIAASFVLHLSIYQWEHIYRWFGYLIYDDMFHKYELLAFAMIWAGLYFYVENKLGKSVIAFVVFMYLLSLFKEFFLNPHKIDYDDYFDLIGSLGMAVLQGLGFFNMIKVKLLDMWKRNRFGTSK